MSDNVIQFTLSTVPLNVSIVNIGINGLVPGSMLVTPAVRFESTNSIPVDVGSRRCHHMCYAIVHSVFTDNTQSDQTTVL